MSAASRKIKKAPAKGIAHIRSTFNNTTITITDRKGDVVAAGTPGMVGYKGSRKSTPYAGQLAGESAGKKAQEHGMKVIDVLVRGPGSGRESALRALSSVGFTITSIKDVTPLPHNGCRPPKRRRV